MRCELLERDGCPLTAAAVIRRTAAQHSFNVPPAARRRRDGPDALPVVTHGRSGAAKIDKIGCLGRSDRRHAKSRRPAKLHQRIGAGETVPTRREPSPTAAQEPRKSTTSDASTAPTTAAWHVRIVGDDAVGCVRPAWSTRSEQCRHSPAATASRCCKYTRLSDRFGQSRDHPSTTARAAQQSQQRLV